ncbi:BTB/POZ domain-containing protein KCTD7 [Biomphalaria pfeifferi]|uniref:BTB/POZ domain-containing protein KCTD7 n=1 Tax=Biomphalaria pfeifferi TaxID=112525 RepID=A0AAD8B5D0_BIOPF|nr:BTB/POZ domain-containing protein KCTD7 [Biomphalaria pfeifferi]
MSFDSPTEGLEVDDDENGSVEEIITVHQIPIPKLLTFQNQKYPNNVWSQYSTSSSPPGDQQRAYKETGTPPFASSLVFPPIIPLNVGGHIYMTRLSTLLKFPDSMLATMFSGRHKIDQDKDGNFFLDSNGAVFEYILEYLRYGSVPPVDKMTFMLFRDANYYGLHELVERLQLKPEIATMAVKEAQRAQFPNYAFVKEETIKIAMARATVSRVGDVSIYAFHKEFIPKAINFNTKHSCVIDNAQLTVGPWDAPADEDTFIRCLENDLMEEGFTLRPHDGKKKCKYYFNQTCQKCIFKITIVFD